ncbi:MAG TPA: putative lipid II flippase FtsW [Methylococcaceae bacterium]|nr:putative lipid II flippase FtsW [Methylococcaceae bacterium]
MTAALWRDGSDMLLVYGEKRFHFDLWLCLAVAALLSLGYVMVVSASLHLGEKMAGDAFHYPLRQFAHIAAGLALAGAVGMVRLECWEKHGLLLFLFGVFLLVLVLVPGLGRTVNGSSRWLMVGGIRIQVSELVKLISVLYMAGFIQRHLQLVRTSVQGMIRPLGLLLAACVLLLMEPDFGSAVVIMATALGMLFLGGARLWQFALLLGGVGAAGVALIYSSPYRMARVLSFLDPWADPLNSGFQLTQALIAFGRGEWAGVGLGSSVQKLFYLPEAHTDFLFSVIGEELGLFGALSVIALFAVVLWRAFHIGREAEAAGLGFGAYLAYGLGLWFGLQAFINMGVNMGVLPTKGLTLPLMSYGGGSMMVMCAALGILLRVDSEAREALGGGTRRNTAWRRVS